ncbi:MAG: prepilin-type N-terminal cleavage/methylation domain-containing protein [Thermaceae bacterium]
MTNRGLTVVELLIAIAVIGLAFSALLSSQLSSLRTSAQARYASDAKAFAVEVLERKSAEVLRVETVPPTSPYLDEEDTGRSFFFIDYYYGCPTPVTPPPGSSIRPNLRRMECRGTEVNPAGIQADWAILGESSAPNPWGVRAEGVVTLVVTARHPQGPQVTVGRRVTCYDVYPSPTHDKPRPCPEPGGGRP